LVPGQHRHRAARGRIEPHGNRSAGKNHRDAWLHRAVHDGEDATTIVQPQGAIMDSTDANSGAHWDHEPARPRARARPRRQATQSMTRTRTTTRTKRRFMESLN